MKRMPFLGFFAALIPGVLVGGLADAATPAPGSLVDGSRRALYAEPEDALYKSPIQLVLTRDGNTLFVSCENTNEVVRLDTRNRVVTGHAGVGRMPFGLALSPDERRLFVTNRHDGTVSVVNTGSMKTDQSFRVGGSPHGIVVDKAGQFVYTANLLTNTVSVTDCALLQEVKRLSAGIQPFCCALSPDGGRIALSHQSSNPVPFRTPTVLELSVISTKTRTIEARRNLFSSIIGQGIAISPDNQFAVTALELPKNLLPETQIYQGFMVTHGFALTELNGKGRSAYLLLDEPNLYFADPFGVAFSPDGRRLYLSSSGADMVSVLDMERIRQLLKIKDGAIGISDDTIAIFGRHLALSSEYVVARIGTGFNPKGLVASSDGAWVYVADRLSDQITVIDAKKLSVAATIPLGGPKSQSLLRRGEQLFNYATISFQRQLSCATCHPEYNVDGLLYDIAADGGMGRNLVDNRTLRGIAETAPFKWSGKNPTLYRQEGPRAAQLFFRSHGFESKADLDAVVKFIESIPIAPNIHQSPTGELNEFQERGKVLYERSKTNDGRYIPMANRCNVCHPAPYYTDTLRHDVGTRAVADLFSQFDTPQLNNVYEGAPYLHDARCYSLEEIWTVHNPEDLHGVTNDMTKNQLNDLIEYLKALSPTIPVPDTALPSPCSGMAAMPALVDVDSIHPSSAQFVGNQTCRTCHAGPYQVWMGSSHARGWISLQRKVSMAIGKDMKMLAANPQYSGRCLGCHATAAMAAPESRSCTFHFEEGISCENCHGPGQKYAVAEIMRDPVRSKSMGIVKKGKESCLVCHAPKVSHERLAGPAFNFDAAWKKIKHPIVRQSKSSVEVGHE